MICFIHALGSVAALLPVSLTPELLAFCLGNRAAAARFRQRSKEPLTAPCM